MKNFILYLMLIGTTTYFAILYNYQVMHFIFLFDLLLPPVLGVWLLLVRRKVQLNVEFPRQTIFLGEKLIAQVHIENTSFFPMPAVRAFMNVEEQGSKAYVETDMDIMIDSYCDSIEQTEYNMPHCGIYRWSVEKIKLYDYLKFFSKNICKKQDWVINVLPKYCYMDLFIDNPIKVSNTENTKFSPYKSGDDVSEIFQIREYRGGDTLQRVHWKMTAKEDQLMVKEYGYPLDNVLVLLVEIPESKEMEAASQRRDQLLELAASLSYSLIHHEFIHQIGWCQGGELRLYSVENQETFFELLTAILQSEHQENISMEELYHRKYPNSQVEDFYLLNTQMQLCRGDEVLEDFSDTSFHDWEGRQVIL